MGKKQDIELLNQYLDILENVFEETALELLETEEKLNNANNIIAKQINHIATLDRQLLQQDKAIERKDLQFEGLKACYKYDLINGRLG